MIDFVCVLHVELLTFTTGPGHFLHNVNFVFGLLNCAFGKFLNKTKKRYLLKSVLDRLITGS